jgi:hypothetical protein
MNNYYPESLGRFKNSKLLKTTLPVVIKKIISTILYLIKKLGRAKASLKTLGGIHMRFYPPKNMELDKISEKKYLRILLDNWRDDLSLVTKFDIRNGRIYHAFLKCSFSDVKNGIFRVWKKNDVIRLYDAILNSKQSANIYQKIDLLDKVFNRNGKLYSELSDLSEKKAFDNMMENSRSFYKDANFIMASYFAKGALMYKNSSEALEMLKRCRQKVSHKKAA